MQPYLFNSRNSPPAHFNQSNSSPPSHKQFEHLRVLLVEDNRADFLLVESFLSDAETWIGFHQFAIELTWAESVSRALETLQNEQFRAIILDLSLPDARGLEAFYAISTVVPNTPIIVLTGFDNETLAAKAIASGAQDYLVKGELDGNIFVRSLLHTIERYEVLKELEKEKEKALLTTQSKSEFLANMSHEVRTPLTPIVGFAEVLTDPAISPEEKQKAIEALRRSCDQLLRVVNDVLDLSKIEADKIDIFPSEYSPFAILSEVEQLTRKKAEEKGLSLIIDYHYPIPKTMITDPVRVKQILMNLVVNAIKFTLQGTVRITTSYQGETKQISFAVSDTGIGLNEKEQAFIFEPFSQAHEIVTSHNHGTGLGLTISKKLAERLGGAITLKSSPGHGSIFTLFIPLGAVSTVELINKEPEPTSFSEGNELLDVPKLHGRVLLAEDGEDNQRLITYLLRKCGLECEIVEDGKMAVERALRSSFDLILMDMQMPVLDGFQATVMLKEKGCPTPIIALSAKAMIQDVCSSKLAGCADHLPKPFTRKEFFGMLTKYLPAQTSFPSTLNLLEETPQYIEIVLGFISHLPSTMAEIEKAVDSLNWKQVSALGHRLKPATLFGFPGLSEAAEKLEHSAQSTDSTAVKESYAHLTAIANEVIGQREKIAALAKSKKD